MKNSFLNIIFFLEIKALLLDFFLYFLSGTISNITGWMEMPAVNVLVKNNH